MENPPTVALIASRRHTCKVMGQLVIYHTCLWALTSPLNRKHYFVSAYRRRGQQEDLETSPIISNSKAEALEIFNLLHQADGGIAPYQLTDVVRDFNLDKGGESPEPTDWLAAEAKAHY